MLATVLRALTLTIAVIATHLAMAAAPATADNHPPVEAGCSGYTYGPTGELICIVAGSQSTPGSSGVRTTGGTPGCFYTELTGVGIDPVQVPCYLDNGAWWDAGRQCYVGPVASEDVETFLAMWEQGGAEVGGTETDAATLYAACFAVPAAGSWDLFWSETPPPPPVMVNPADLAAAAIGSMGLQAITPQTAPRAQSVDPTSRGRVGLPVWLWTEPTPTTWGPQTASASALGVTVTATIGVDELQWNMGDGTTYICGAGVAYDPDWGPERRPEAANGECGHVYNHVNMYTVTATTFWTGEWSGGGQAGGVSLDLETSEQLDIGEIQVVRTQ